MALQTNQAMIEAILQKFPNAIDNMSEYAMQMITSEGFDRVDSINSMFKDEFLNVAFKFYYQFINVPDVRDNLAINGFGEVYRTPYGGYIERLAMEQVKECNPAYLNLANGQSVDPYVVNIPIVNGRYFKFNDNFQAWITRRDDFNYKQVYTSPTGIDEYFRGLMQVLNNAYTKHRYDLKLEALNGFINGTIAPLQDTQVVETNLSLNTERGATDFILKVKNIITVMTTSLSTSQFNSAKYDTVQDKSRLKLLLRQGYRNSIEVNTLVGAFNPEYLSLGVDIIEVPNFGGVRPYADADYDTELYPVYNKDGVMIGYSTTEGSSTADYTGTIYEKDPNADVIGILADKGLIFESVQNPYQVEPQRNARGRYTNFFASAPNNALHFDNYFNAVVFKENNDPVRNIPQEVYVTNTVNVKNVE